MKYKVSTLISFFSLLVVFILLLIPSKENESNENRTMATFEMVFHPQKDSVVYHNNPVERLEAALSDQFPFREQLIRRYLFLFNTSENLSRSIAKGFSPQGNEQHVLRAIANFELIDDTGYITEQPSTKTMEANLVNKHIKQIRHLHKAFPNLKFYVYYVTQAFNTPWFNDYLGATVADHYQEIVEAVPSYVKTEHLVYRDLDDYMDIHYKTDHHWNHRGAKRGYENVYSMFEEDFDMSPMLAPKAENMASDTYGFLFLGSYGKALNTLYEGYDDFSFYEYTFPRRELAVLDPETREEIPAVKIGLYDEYNAGKIEKSLKTEHYRVMYGTARDSDGQSYPDSDYLFVIRNSSGNGKNLLICGDSYSRAMRDLLASHFDTTVYFDYRTLHKLPVDYVIEKYAIDVMLISSHDSMWNSENYFFKFKEDE